MRRSEFVAGLGIATFAMSPPSASVERAEIALQEIERSTGGRLGVAAIDAGTHAILEHRADERFPMRSTFKVLAAAAILRNVDRGAESLDRKIHFTASDLLTYAPITAANVREGSMTVGALCGAAIEYSDNTAANLLLQALGGPPKVTSFARSIGDPLTRLDRFEPDLNSALPGDPRDTTTPAAMAADLQAVMLGNALSRASRASLAGWMLRCTTGASSLRAGFPTGWRIGDKTGSGGRRNTTGDSDTHNDIAVVWPPRQEPLVIAAYLTGANVSAAKSEAALAAVGRLANAWIAGAVASTERG